MKNRDEFLNKIKEYEKKYPKSKKCSKTTTLVWLESFTKEIEFWLELENRSHERLIYKKEKNKWIKEMLYP